MSVSQIENPFTYTGRRLDEETGLYYYRARHYSSELKRFTQRDPLGYVDGPNAFTYALGRPVVASDPHGTTIYISAEDEGADALLYRASACGGLGFDVGPANSDGWKKVSFRRNDILPCVSMTFREILEAASDSEIDIYIRFRSGGNKTFISPPRGPGAGSSNLFINKKDFEDCCGKDGAAVQMAYELDKVTTGQPGALGPGTDQQDIPNSPSGRKARKVYEELQDAIRREKELAAKKMARQKEKEDAIHGK